MQSKLVFDKRTHQYFLEGRKLISVTKIINTYLGTSYDGVPKDILKNASIRGQWVHKALETYLRNINKESIIDLILEQLKPLTNDNNYSLCKKSLEFISNELTNQNEYDIEQPIYFDNVAGIPDLLVKTKEKNYLVDYKTYSSFTKELKEKAELQMTAYYWILTNNGINVDKTAYIFWINKNVEHKVEINITDQSLHNWVMAINSFMQWEG